MNPVLNSLRMVKKFARAAAGRELWQTEQFHAGCLTLGDEHADWTMLASPLPAGSVVYSLGVGENISFDLELIRRFGVTVHAFDPTPRAIAWIAAQDLPPEFVFHPFGVGRLDGTCPFSPPRDIRHVSHSLVQRDTPWPAIEVPVRRLTTVVRTLGHARIELLKMDIEGSEYDVIDDLLAAELPVGQLLVEFHHRWPELGLARTRQAIRRLNAAGFRIFHISPNGDEYSFLHRSLKQGASASRVANF